MKTRSLCLVALAAALLSLALGAAPAAASRALLSEALLRTSPGPPPIPPPEAEIEGACGLAISPDGSLYVSDYYHRAVDVFSQAGDYQFQIALPGSNPVFGTNTLDAVCGLALDSAGRLYANEWHEGVVRLQPSEAVIDSGESTGVAVDAAGDLFVDDRTHVNEYEAPVEAGDVPAAEIDLGAPADAYGLAVSPSGTRVYVADATSRTVRVFDPATGLPVATVAPPSGFESLVDAAVAIDPTNGHLLVLDNTQPGYEHPKSAVYEFEAGPSDSYAFLGRLPGAPIDGEPSGVAVDPSSGALYVTSGNDEGANVFAYGAYSASAALLAGPAAAAPVPAGAALEAPAGAAATPARPPASRHRSTATASEVVQRGPVRVKVDGRLSPTALPRRGAAPVRVALDTEIAATDGGTLPQLRQIAIAINRNGHFEPNGLSRCRLSDIQPSTTAGALGACRGALVGEGRFSADVRLPEQSPFPSAGKVLAFNGVSHGHPVILAHVFGTKPVPTSLTLIFSIGSAKGTYGTVLRASVPEATGDSGFITGLSLNLGRSFGSGAQRRSYISAGCPAPAGFPGASFPLARVSFGFAGGPQLTSVLTRSCKVG